MSEITRVALDAMGGDNAPQEIVSGAVQAVQKRKDIQVFLVGKEDVLKECLSSYSYPTDQIEIVHAPEVIESRIAKAEYELGFAPQFDCVIVNDNLETAKAEALKVIKEFLEQ